MNKTQIFLNYLPYWKKISPQERNFIENNSKIQLFKKGETIYRGTIDCTGMLLVLSGRLRSFIISENGREITLYRLLEGDMCIFAASCIFDNIDFHVNISSETESKILIIPAAAYKQLCENSIEISEHTNSIMATRFSDVMWVMEQLLFASFDKRLASFLVEQSNIENSKILNITHEEIARHLGSAREVVTRMLKYFSDEGYVRLSRGKIELIDLLALSRIA